MGLVHLPAGVNINVPAEPLRGVGARSSIRARHVGDSMFEQWAPALVFLAICLVVPMTMLIPAAMLRVRARVDVATKFDTYECGEEPDGPAWIRFHPRYYVVALLFVLFDVEAAFLFPWALNLRDPSLGFVAIIDMLVFVGILFIGWAYAVRKGAIKWQ
jgi:NADH-quinone oxidoreductase subunit A